MSSTFIPILFGSSSLIYCFVNLWAFVPIILLDFTINWEAMSAIGESLGAAAVVFSLVYVGRQLKQNSAMMRVAAATETLEIDHTIILPIIESEEFSEIWLKGDNRLNELSEANLNRLMIFERRAFTLWHHNYQLRHQKLLTDDTWYYQNMMIQFLSLREACRVAWSIFKNTYEASFRDYVDEQFRIAENTFGKQENQPSPA